MSSHRNDAREPRLTMPLAPNAHAAGAMELSGASQLRMRNKCGMCHGKRTTDTVGGARCPVCGKWHWRDTFRSLHVYPCGHAPRDGGKIAMCYEPCETCGGEGYVYGWIALDPAIDFALRWIAENYETFSQAVTAILPSASKLPKAM